MVEWVEPGGVGLKPGLKPACKPVGPGLGWILELDPGSVREARVARGGLDFWTEGGLGRFGSSNPVD
jgi:hypothetical protein